jgi:hypothetical protein
MAFSWQLYFFTKALAFNRDRCCHLSICLWLILFHYTFKNKLEHFSCLYTAHHSLEFSSKVRCATQVSPGCQPKPGQTKFTVSTALAYLPNFQLHHKIVYSNYSKRNFLLRYSKQTLQKNMKRWLSIFLESIFQKTLWRSSYKFS